MGGYVMLAGEKESSALRVLAMQLLKKQGMSQSAIAMAFGISQPMVSKCLQAPEAKSSGDMQRRARRLASLARAGRLHSYTLFSSEAFASGNEYAVIAKGSSMDDERMAVLEAVSLAVDKLRGKDCSSVLPKVKVNIAMAVARPQSAKDVAAITSGLIFSKGYLQQSLEPEFGASSHLSMVLLEVRKKFPNLSSVMNVRYDSAIPKKARQHQLIAQVMSNKFILSGGRECPDIAFHKGAFGIEPCSYLLGNTASEVISRCLMLL